MRGRPDRGALPRPGASLHRTSARSDPGARPGGRAAAQRAGRRAAFAAGAAFRLPLPHALWARRPTLRRGEAGAQPDRARPSGRLPPPADRGSLIAPVLHAKIGSDSIYDLKRPMVGIAP